MVIVLQFLLLFLRRKMSFNLMWTVPQSQIIHICLNFMLGLWNHNKPPKKGWLGTHPWCRSTSASPLSWPQSLSTVVSCLRPTWFPSATTFSCSGLLPLYSSRKWITSKRVCSDVWLLDVFHTGSQSIRLWGNDNWERSVCFELVVQFHLAAQPAWQENSAPGLWASPRTWTFLCTGFWSEIWLDFFSPFI